MLAFCQFKLFVNSMEAWLWLLTLAKHRAR